jgi:hypothetical protein
MNELENKIRDLQLKKALLYLDIESLSEVDESLFTQLGKVEAERLKIKKQLLRKTENIIG